MSADPLPTATALVLPRPNPGPEPLDGEGAAFSWPYAAFVLGFAVIPLFLYVRKRKKRALRQSHSASPRMLPEGATLDARVIGLSDLAREALAARFGAAWHAKTTEEIGAAPEFRDGLAPATAANLLLLFRLADRLKFAGPSRDDADAAEEAPLPFEEWAGLIEALGSPAPAPTR